MRMWYGRIGGGTVSCVFAGMLGLVLVGCDCAGHDARRAAG